MKLFHKIKALFHYIISTPHYLYTRYTAAKQRYREEQRLMNKLLVNDMNLIKYKDELFNLTKYSAYLKASVTCFDELKGRTPTVELGEHKSYSIFMKSYVEQDLEMLQKYKSELESLNIQFLDEERGDLIIGYSDRISVQNSYILSCVNTVKDVDKSTNKEITSNSNSNSNIQLKDTVEAPLNEENQVNQLNIELNRIMNGVTNGKMTYIANTTKLLHTTYNQLEALRSDYIMKTEVLHLLYSTILFDVVQLEDLNKKQGELESAVIMYSEDMQKENDLKDLESTQGNSTEVATHITRYNTAESYLKVHEEEARINKNKIQVIRDTIEDNTKLLDDQRSSLGDRALELDNNLAEIRKLLSHIKRDPQMLNKEAEEEDRTTHSHHVLTVNEALLEDIATANNEFIKNALDNENQAASKMRKSILQGPSYLVSTRRQDRYVTEPSSRPSTSRSTSSTKSGTLNLNKNDSSPLARKESHKKDVDRVSSIKKKDDTALLNISQEISSGQNNSFATVTDTPTKGTIMGPNEESVGL